jgi:hypothetical protein
MSQKVLLSNQRETKRRGEMGRNNGWQMFSLTDFFEEIEDVKL